MTVCVAAICGKNQVILGASDRMITAGDIQVELPQTKIYHLTQSIAIMVGGDGLLNNEILKGVERDKSPAMSVLEAAESYRAHYQNAFLTRVENTILAKLNLNRRTFLTKQQRMSPELVRDISTEILRFEPSEEGVEVIFAGIDTTGPHLYVVRGSEIACYDTIGFAAIGSGSWHAQSHLMFENHTRWWPVPESMLNIYWAKKRAEVAPHVGVATDMFSISMHATPPFFRVPLELVDQLEDIYQGIKKKEQDIRAAAGGDIHEFIKAIQQAVADKRAEAASAEGGDSEAAPATGEENREDADRAEDTNEEGEA